MTNEQKRKRILEAKAVLIKAFRGDFSKPHWDIKQGRLYSHNYGLYLQWQECNRPDLPESYENQKPTGGVVFLVQNTLFSESEFRIGTVQKLDS